MPVKLYTGLPGHGKTAALVEEIVNLREKEPTRPIFARGIDGLKEGLAEPLTDELLENWIEKLPPGSIMAIDEAQECMPLDRGQPAQWIRDISKIRHEGMDMLLTTQHPTLISAYVRKLVDTHVHTVRKFNTNILEKYTWGRCMETPEKTRTQKAGTVAIGKLPDKVFDLYKSASLHTMKKKIPLKAYMIIVFIILGISAAVALPFVLKNMRDKAQAIGGQPAQMKRPNAQVLAQEQAAEVHTDYVKAMTPRVEGIPWTAPAFDGKQVQSDPEIFCIAVENGDCHCISEQGTKWKVEPKICRQIARDGSPYNPFKASQSQTGNNGGSSQPSSNQQSPQPMSQSAPPPAEPALNASGGWKQSEMRKNYTPPELVPENP